MNIKPIRTRLFARIKPAATTKQTVPAVKTPSLLIVKLIKKTPKLKKAALSIMALGAAFTLNSCQQSQNKTDDTQSAGVENLMQADTTAQGIDKYLNQSEGKTFTYEVQQGDKGLFDIFLKQSKDCGYEGELTDWKSGLNTLKEIQQEEKSEGSRLYSGGEQTDNWRKNFVIRPGDKIELSQAQLDKIYTSMGLQKIQTEENKTVKENGELAESISESSFANRLTQKIQQSFSSTGIRYKQAEQLMKSIPYDWAAYVVSGYPDMEKDIKSWTLTESQPLVATQFLRKLVKRANELGIETQGMKKWNLDYETKLKNIRILSTQIIDKEKETGSVQDMFSRAANLILQFLAQDPKPEIIFTQNPHNWNKVAIINFSDDKFINVAYDYENKIKSVAVSYEKNKNPKEEIAEVLYQSNGIYAVNSKQKFRRKIADGYNFEKLQNALNPVLSQEEARQIEAAKQLKK